MKNNPFITVLLLICIEILLYNYLDYADFEIRINGDLFLAFFCFLIPVFSIVLNFFIKDYPNKKAFRFLTIFVVIVSVIFFAGITYLGALGKAYQH